MESVTKSTVLTGLIKSIPAIVDSKDDNVRALATLEKNPFLSLEDASGLIGDLAGEPVEKKAKDLQLNIYGTTKLKAEIELAKNIDRNKYLDFKDKWDDLRAAIKDLDNKFGPQVEFLLDELTQTENVNKEEIQKLMNVDISFVDIEKWPIASREKHPG